MTAGTPTKPTSLRQVSFSSLQESGFPLQTAVVDIVRRHPTWEVAAEEHPWKDEGRDEFVDLVASRKGLRLVIECKRLSDVSLTFLQTTTGADRETRAIAATVRIGPGSGHPWSVRPQLWDLSAQSDEAMYCVSSRDAKRRLLEDDAGLVARAAEAFARQIADTESAAEGWNKHVPVVGVVVTTARLFVAEYPPSAVGLKDGRIKKGDLRRHHEVPWVRFRKAFFSPWNLGETSQRTVFVVSTLRLEELLSALSIPETLVR